MKVHLRSRNIRTMAMCGQGYRWPSAIALRDEEQIDEVTCKACLRAHLDPEDGVEVE